MNTTEEFAESAEASEEELREERLADSAGDVFPQSEPTGLEGHEQPARATKGEQPASERPVEVASAETSNLETTGEEKPRRRQRKPDPQASLPF
jgi:hypothetical protein